MSSSGSAPDLGIYVRNFSAVLLPGARIRLEIAFASAYEAGISYQDLLDALETGVLNLKFKVEGRAP